MPEAAGTTGTSATGSAAAAGVEDKSGEQSTLLGGAKGGEAKVEGVGADGVKLDGKGDKTDPDDAGAKVPEKYEFVAPDGVELDPAATDEFSALAKDLKLSAKDAQRVADIAVSMAQRQTEAFATTVKGWETQSRADAEFGGDALEANMAIAQKALDTYGSPALIEVMQQFGFLNHPEVIRAFYKIGKATESDGFVKGGPADSTNAPLANRMYPNQK